MIKEIVSEIIFRISGKRIEIKILQKKGEIDFGIGLDGLGAGEL